MARDWIDGLNDTRAKGERLVLVTVMGTAGSTPREVGAKMAVCRDRTFGTVGGGTLEFAAIDVARGLLDEDQQPPPLFRDYPLGPALGQCCGGNVALLFEAIWPPRRAIAIFGAGHVGRALAGILGTAPVSISWIDSREDAFPNAAPANAQLIHAADPVAAVAQLPSGAAIVIMTHSHALDFDLTLAALRRSDLPYVGLIGSATKRARFMGRFKAAGLTPEDRARLVCPIGVPGISGSHPGEIAIGVAAQILQRLDGVGSESTTARQMATETAR